MLKKIHYEVKVEIVAIADEYPQGEDVRILGEFNEALRKKAEDLAQKILHEAENKALPAFFSKDRTFGWGFYDREAMFNMMKKYALWPNGEKTWT